MFKVLAVLGMIAATSHCCYAAPIQKQNQNVARLPEKTSSPQKLKLHSIRLSRLGNHDPREGALAVEIRLIYTGQKPLWSVDEPLPIASYEESWTRLPNFRKWADSSSHDLLYVDQNFRLENERGERLETTYAFQFDAAVYVRRPTLQKNGTIRVLFPLSVWRIPLNGPVKDWDDVLKPFKRVYFFAEVGIQGDGVLPIRFSIPLATLQNERKRLKKKRIVDGNKS